MPTSRKREPKKPQATATIAEQGEKKEGGKMGLLNLGVADLPDPVEASPGEANLVILDIEVKESQKTSGSFYINVRLGISGQQDAVNVKDIYQMLSLPKEGDEAKAQYRKRLSIRDFMRCFDVPISDDVDISTWIGCSGPVILKTKTDEYGTKSVISSYLRS